MANIKFVGILNITPDSFSDGDAKITPEKALSRAKQLVEDGVDIIDIGAEATNPFVKPLTAEQEWDRLKDVLPAIIHTFPNQVSLDTYHWQTAEKALNIGPVIINDVTSFRDPVMIKLVAEYRVTCIVSHLPFAARSIAEAHANATISSMEQVKQELLQRRSEMITAGIDAGNIIIDPGIGFGKTTELNKRLLEFAKEVPGIPVLIGHSRKRFLGEKRFEIEPNLAAARVAVAAGASYLRVHDAENYRAILN